MDEQDKQTQKEKKKKEKSQSYEKKTRRDSIQDEQDRQTWVREIDMGYGGSRSLILDFEGVDVVALPIVDPVLVGIVAEESGIWSKDPHFSVYVPTPWVPRYDFIPTLVICFSTRDRVMFLSWRGGTKKFWD